MSTRTSSKKIQPDAAAAKNIAVVYAKLAVHQKAPLKPVFKKAPKKTHKSDIPSIDEQAELILANMESAIRIAWSMLNRWRVRLPSDEVQSVTGVALCEAASRFDRCMGVAFRTFFFYHLRGLLLREISSRIKDGRSRSIVDEIEHHAAQHEGDSFIGWPVALIDAHTPEKKVSEEELSRLTWDACHALDDLERDIILRFFVNDQTVADIAKDLGYCRCHVSRVKSRALDSLARRLEPILGDQSESAAKPLLKTEAALERLRKPTYRGGRGRRRTTSNESEKAEKAA